MATFDDLRGQAEEIGLEENVKTKLLTQGWKMILEAEERKLAVEAEERKLKLEAKERKLAAEAEEQKVAAEATKHEAERKHKLEMKKLLLQRERLTELGSASSED